MTHGDGIHSLGSERVEGRKTWLWKKKDHPWGLEGKFSRLVANTVGKESWVSYLSSPLNLTLPPKVA